MIDAISKNFAIVAVIKELKDTVNSMVCIKANGYKTFHFYHRHNVGTYGSAFIQ